jgi:CheY-like chemotaxis protein
VERRHILLIDDNPHDVELALNAFGDSGDHEVSVAGSGAEALAALRSACPLPDLILLDLKMPQMDGLPAPAASRS